MNLVNLIKKGGLGVFATATPATVATHNPDSTPTVAGVATVAVANASKQAVNDPAGMIDWRVLDAAYLAHHVNCKACIAAGRGIQYGLRCGVGAALWRSYSDAAKQPTNNPGGKTT